jgi:hypothetical protein
MAEGMADASPAAIKASPVGGRQAGTVTSLAQVVEMWLQLDPQPAIAGLQRVICSEGDPAETVQNGLPWLHPAFLSDMRIEFLT